MRIVSLAVGVTLVTLTGCGGSGTHSTAPPQSTTPPTTSSQQTASAPAKPTPTPPPAPSSGSLPQTHELPSADTNGFGAEMGALWRGIRANSPNTALSAFFPAGAYAQVKAIADPPADYENRLVHEYRLDLAAAHALVAPDAQLVGVDVARAAAHWVSPGTCYNRVGYYEVPGSRLVYRQRGRIRSFGIASMISWRGVWYVVHLGTVNRSGDRGVVDQAAVGRGTAGTFPTC